MWPLTLDPCPLSSVWNSQHHPSKEGGSDIGPFDTSSKGEEWGGQEIKSYVISPALFTLKLDLFIKMTVGHCTHPSTSKSLLQIQACQVSSYLKHDSFLHVCISEIRNEFISCGVFLPPKIVIKFDSMSNNQWHIIYLHAYIWYIWLFICMHIFDIFGRGNVRFEEVAYTSACTCVTLRSFWTPDGRIPVPSSIHPHSIPLVTATLCHWLNAFNDTSAPQESWAPSSGGELPGFHLLKLSPQRMNANSKVKWQGNFYP